RSTKHTIYLPEQLPDDFVTRASFGKFASQFVKCPRSFFAPALRLALHANAGNELTQNNRHHEISAKKNRVIDRPDDQGETRRQKEKVPHERAQCAGEKHRTAPYKECQQNDYEQKNQAGNAWCGDRDKWQVNQSGRNDNTRGQGILPRIGREHWTPARFV